jgi:hypothetical protein
VDSFPDEVTEYFNLPNRHFLIVVDEIAAQSNF